jgi:hypothetical protein
VLRVVRVSARLITDHTAVPSLTRRSRSCPVRNVCTVYVCTCDASHSRCADRTLFAAPARLALPVAGTAAAAGKDTGAAAAKEGDDDAHADAASPHVRDGMHQSYFDPSPPPLM